MAKLFSRMRTHSSLRDSLTLGATDKHTRLNGTAKMWFRANIMSLLDVNTKTQEFSVEMILIGQTQGMKDLRVIANDGALHPITLANWEPRITCLNEVKTTSWRMRGKENDGELLFKWLLKMTFGNEFELDYFPFDMQELEMVFSSPIPTSNLAFIPADDSNESVIQRSNFRLNKVFFLFRKVRVKTSMTSKADSGSGKQRPVLKITSVIRRQVGTAAGRTCLAHARCFRVRNDRRRPRSVFDHLPLLFLAPMHGPTQSEFFKWNVELPMGCLTGLSFTVSSIPLDDVQGRLSVTLTLLLTLVAYKLVISAELPAVSYLTILDKYILVCILLLVAVTVESAVSSAVASEALDRAVLGLMGALFVLLLVVYYWFVRPWATQMGNPTISQKRLQSLTQHEREYVQREKKRLEEKARQKAMDGRKRRAASETDGGTAAGGYDSGEDSSGAEDARVVRQIADSKRTVSMTMGHGGADSNGGIATTTLDEMPLGTTV